MKEEIKEIKELLCEVLQMEISEIEEYNIDENSFLVNGLGENQIPLSSYDYVSFITLLEDKYNLLYDFENPIETIDDVIKLIRKSKEWGKKDNDKYSR